MKRSMTVALLAPLAACSEAPPVPPAPAPYASHTECEAATKDGRGCHRAHSGGSGSNALLWYYIASNHTSSPSSSGGAVPFAGVRSRPRNAITNARATFSRSGVPFTGASRGGFGATGRSLSVSS